MPSSTNKSNWYFERQGQGIQYSLRLLNGSNKIGRRPNSNIIITDSSYISREHCEINISEPQIELIDYSTNGTFVNEEQVHNETKILNENDKIGVGVNDVNDEELTNVEFHVYILRKIPNLENELHNIRHVIMCPAIIDLVDSDSEKDTIQNELMDNNPINNSKKVETNNKVRIISDVIISKPCLLSDFDKVTDKNELPNTSKKLFQIQKSPNKNDLKIVNIKTEQNIPKQKPILTIDIVSDDDDDDDKNPNSTEAIKKNINNSVIFEISDDEDFQCSQYLMQDIKQEINDFDLEINNKISHKQNYDNDQHEKLSSPVYDLLNEDNDGEEIEEFDENLANWYIKLSQGLVVKQELKEEEIYNENDNIIEEGADIYDIPKLEPNNLEEENDKDVSVDNKEKESFQIPQKYLPQNENKNNYSKIEKSKIIRLIDAPSLPPHKGKLRGVSADRKSTNLFDNTKISIKDRKLNREKDFKEKWLSKSNRAKEREKVKKNHDDRKEKLKLIADKETQKRKINEPKDSRAYKKPKVKITNSNRGAFLTEIPTDIKSIPCKRRNSEIENAIKVNKIPRIAQTSVTTPRESGSTKEKLSFKSLKDSIENKFEKLRKDSIEKNSEKLRKDCMDKRPEKLSSVDKRPEKVRKDSVEKRPEKLRFKSLTASDLTITKKETLKKSQTLKSILVTKHKSEHQKIVKKVRFIEKPKITYFDIEMTDDESIKTPKKFVQKDLQLDLTLLSERKKLRLRTYSLINLTEKILSEILLWKTDWLESGSEEVNGANHRLTPMLHQFPTLSEYENIIFPFLKLEMWVQLRNNFKAGIANNFVQFKLNDFRIDDKSKNKRTIYNCQYPANKNQPQNLFLPGDFILMEINSNKFFGYVRENTFICNINQNYCCATIESKLNNFLPTNYIKVKKLSSITIELGQFNAVSGLKYSPLLKYVLNPISLPKRNSTPINNIKYKGFTKLNDIQTDTLLRTYLKCINPQESNITLIEGPPGTGKSCLITNLALQILYGEEVRKLDRRILICAPSNTAVDVITLQLIKIRKKMTPGRFNLVRFGVVERMHPEARAFSLTGLIEYNRKNDRNNLISLEAEKIFIENKIKIITQNNHQNTVDQNELYNLKQNLNRINSLINPEIKNSDSDKVLYPKFLAGAHIICTTLPSCVRLLKYLKFFDVCIIDEATQCSEPWSLIPFQFTINSLVLVGDKQQLPPIVLSKLNKEYNYGTSLFTRITECLEHNVNTNPILSLRTQYRMHPEICRWPNSYFYKNKLINNSNVLEFKIKVKPYLIFNLDYNQNKSTEIGNISNTHESRFIIKLLKYLKEIMPFGLYKYGIITPYAKHRDILQKHLLESNILQVVASTVDSYQGKEKDIIIISNGRTEGVGFLNEASRLNVCLTRAKVCLILCGNFSNLNHVPVWRSLLNDAKNRNLYYNITSNDIVNFNDNVTKKIII